MSTKPFAGCIYLSAVATPDQLQTKKPQIFFSGRIDNRNQLTKELGLPSSVDDNTFVLASFLRWSEALADKWRGDFAVVIWDPAKQELYAARDIFGCQPFYYFYDKEHFIFAECIPALLSQPRVPCAWNEREMVSLFTEVLMSAKTYTDETYHQHILRLTPGHYIKITPAGMVKKSYWTLSIDRPDLILRDEGEYLEALTEKLEQAVKVRLGTQPVAIECSGGLDTSLVLTTAKKLSPALRAFAHVNGPSDTGEDERARMELIVKTLGIAANWVNAEAFDLKAGLDHCAKIFAGPMPFVFFYFASVLHQAVNHQGHKVLLSGFGGDECVSSHASIFLPTFLTEFGWREAWHAWKAHYQFHHAANPSFTRGVSKLLKTRLQMLKLNYPRWRHPANTHIRHLYIKPELAKKYQLPTHFRNQYMGAFYPSIPACEHDQLVGPNSYHARMRVEYSAILAKSMGFEYRYPLLDRDLVEFCYALPIKLKRNQGRGRYLARKYLSRYLPAGIYDNPSKRGAIFPATRQKFQRSVIQGDFDHILQNPPYVNLPDEAMEKPKPNWQFSLIYAYLMQACAK